ncbi:peptide-binding protein [Candidatus Saganbacteria bacterium]|nr:peptide-binding protein [Candidatus Saganbacteria bacterium]
MKRVIILLSLLLLLPAHPSLSLPIPAVDPNGKLIFSLGGEVSVLNPILSTDSASSSVEDVIFSGLTRINEKLEVIPDMAESWSTSKDGKVWTIKLKKNIKWHDGKEFSADDVKFTFDSILNPKVNSIRRSDYIIDGQQIKFVIINKYTVQAILPKPFAPFLSRLGIGIIPKHLLQNKDINTAAFNRHPIGTGPFKFSEWKTGDFVKVVRNDKFFRGRPLLSSIIFRIIPDENATLAALEAGEIDSAGIPPKDYTRMKSVKGINVFEYDTLLYTYLGLNNDSPIFSNKKVRQAMAYAVNKKQLISLALKKQGTPAYAPASPVSWSYSDDVFKYEYDPAKSKAMLDSLGYKNDPRFEFTCIINQGNKEREKAAVILQQQFKKIGIKMDIKILEWAALLRIVNSPKQHKDFDAVIIGWSLGLDPDSHSIWHSTQYPKGFNFIKYVNPKVDRLLEQGRVEMNKNKRKKIYGELNKLISEDQPYIFLWFPHSVIGVRDRVGGLSKPGPAGIFLNIEKVFIKK